VAHIIDQNIVGDGSAIRTAVIFFYLSNEGISIIENAPFYGANNYSSKKSMILITLIPE